MIHDPEIGVPFSPLKEVGVCDAPAISRGVGLLNEKPLHAALKTWYAQPGDRFEVAVDGSIIDIVRGELLVEIQTRSFSSLKRKLERLTASHPVRMVYPVAAEKWILRLSDDGSGQEGRRRSPKRGSILELFRELVSFPQLICHPNFSLEVLLIEEEEVRQQGAARNWRRRGWGTVERRLIGVVDRRLFATPADFAVLIPASLAETFTAKELAEATGQPRWLAQKMIYCLRSMGAISEAGKQGRSTTYKRAG
jgi:hypothetical protein